MLTAASRRAATDHADTVAFVPALPGRDERGITYAELDRAADEAAAGLAESGVGEGAVVALLTASDADHVVAYLALARLGAVTAGINHRLRPREVGACLDTLRPDLVVADRTRADTLADRLTGHRVVLVGSGTTPLAELRLGGGRVPPLADDPDRPVCICFTSGSTGTPRAAVFTGRQLAAVAHLDTGGAWGGGGHALSPTSMAHVGFMTKLPWLLASGRTTHLLERWSAGPVLDLIARHRMSAVTGVAPQIALLVGHPDAGRLDFSAVRAIVVGGAASPPSLVRRARSVFGAPYSIRYSSTESGGVGLATALDADDDEALHTIGRPRPGVDAEVRDEAGRSLPPGEVGELWLRSPAVMSGYWNDPAATSAVLVDGWLRTGDLARVDGRGLFRLAGRSSEMFIRGGYNVHPQEVEAVLAEHPAVADVVVVPRPDGVMGEIGVAVVVPADRARPPSLDELRRFAAADLAHWKLPEALRCVDALPRNASDKVDRLALAAAERARFQG